MRTLLQEVAEIGEARGFLFSVVLRADGHELARHGDPSLLSWAGLVQALFGGSEEVQRALSAMDVGDARVLGQGTVRCVYLKPAPRVLAGFFRQDSAGAAALRRMGLEICGHLARVLAGTGTEAEPEPR